MVFRNLSDGQRRRRPGSRGQPEESRAGILKAAVREFAEHGIAGSRTDAIARAAKVNKALLYYYFKGKETPYGAVLNHAFSGLKKAVFKVLESDLPPREKDYCVRWSVLRLHRFQSHLSEIDAAGNDARP